MSAMRLRRVTLHGETWRLAGWEDDSFFRNAGHHMRGMAELAAVARAVLEGGGVTPGRAEAGTPGRAGGGAPGRVVVDVGANLGLSVLALAPLAARVLAVEASPRIAAALRRTVEANGLEARVAVAAVALGATPGELAFHDSAHSAGSHLMSAETLGGQALPTVTVPVETLDALVARHGLGRIGFIKIDVEGHETEVLDGAAATLARDQPTVFLEFNAWVLQANRRANPRAVLEDWLARFPVAHALRGAAPPMPVTPATLLDFLHEHLVQRGCADDLVLGFDDAWVGRWQAP